MMGWPGKCPLKNGSFAETFLRPTILRPGSNSRMRSTRMNG